MITFRKNPTELKTLYSIFNSVIFAVIANEIQTPSESTFTNKKLDLDKFYNYLKTKGFKYSFIQMRDLVLEAAPILGITKYLKLSKEEKPEMLFAEKYIYGEIPIGYFSECEILAEQAVLDSDYVVRSMWGETEPAYYRVKFSKDYKKAEHERNLLRVAYIQKYGDPEKTPWRNYLDARPCSMGEIKKNGKSVNGTREIGDFIEKVYN